jgi:hypothetical protein
MEGCGVAKANPIGQELVFKQAGNQTGKQHYHLVVGLKQ